MRKPLAYALTLCLLTVALSFGQITYDTSADLGHVGASTMTLTNPYTMGSVSNGILIVGVGFYSSTTLTVSTVTYNGVSCAAAGTATNNGVNQPSIAQWYCLSPASGTHDVVVTLTGTATGGHQMILTGVSFGGVAQTAPEASNGPLAVATGTNTTQSNNLTTVANNAWLVDVELRIGATPNFVASGSQVSRIVNTSDGSDSAMATSTLGPVTPAGSTAMAWTFASTGSAIAHSIISLAPAASGSIRHRVTR